MAKIYEQHRAAFRDVSAYVVLHEGRRVATIAFKYPRDGAGRLYAYVHWLGTEMVRGFAGGGGYDKRSAACGIAAGKMPDLSRDIYPSGEPLHDAAERESFDAFRSALAKDDGHGWDAQLQRVGFRVLQAV